MKWLCITFLICCVMLSFAEPVMGEQKMDFPAVVESVVRNQDFFTQTLALRKYENYYLYDVNRLNSGQIGVVLVCPSGFEIRLVYDVNTLGILYYDMLMPEKTKREAMKRKSISVADAVRLATFAADTTKKRSSIIINDER